MSRRRYDSDSRGRSSVRGRPCHRPGRCRLRPRPRQVDRMGRCQLPPSTCRRPDRSARRQNHDGHDSRGCPAALADPFPRARPHRAWCTAVRALRRCARGMRPHREYFSTTGAAVVTSHGSVSPEKDGPGSVRRGILGELSSCGPAPRSVPVESEPRGLIRDAQSLPTDHTASMNAPALATCARASPPT
jgi:hypothetical protein